MRMRSLPLYVRPEPPESRSDSKNTNVDPAGALQPQASCQNGPGKTPATADCLRYLHDVVDHRRVLERLSISIVCTLKPGSRNRQRITGNLAIKCCKWVSTAATIAARSTLLSILWLPAMTEVPPAPFVDTENQPKVHGILPKSPEYHREPPRLPKIALKLP